MQGKVKSVISEKEVQFYATSVEDRFETTHLLEQVFLRSSSTVCRKSLLTTCYFVTLTFNQIGPV